MKWSVSPNSLRMWDVFVGPRKKEDIIPNARKYLREVASLGFDEATWMGFLLIPGDVSWDERYKIAKELRAELDSFGLGYCGDGWFSHLPPTHDRWQRERLIGHAERDAKLISILGGYQCNPNAPQRFMGYEWNKEKWLGIVAECWNEAGKKFKDYGIDLGMHNHCNSLVEYRDEIDMFMRLTDLEYVKFSPDTGHLAVANEDYLDIIKDHKDRIVGFDMKDVFSPGTVYPHWIGPGDVASESWDNTRPLGMGNVDLVGIFRIAVGAGLDGFGTMEQENSKGISDAKIGKRFIDEKLKPLFK